MEHDPIRGTLRAPMSGTPLHRTTCGACFSEGGASQTAPGPPRDWHRGLQRPHHGEEIFARACERYQSILQVPRRNAGICCVCFAMAGIGSGRWEGCAIDTARVLPSLSSCRRSNDDARGSGATLHSSLQPAEGWRCLAQVPT